MQMHEVGEVTQVAGAVNANTKLAEGWTLLAVTSAGNGGGTMEKRSSGSAGEYQVVMDYAKYRDDSGSGGRFTRVGVGVRVIANITTKKANVDLGNIFAIAVAAKSGYLSGDIEVLKIGIDSPHYGQVLQSATDISDASLQGALQSVAIIRARLSDNDTFLTPHIIAEQYDKQNLKLVEN